MGSITSADAKCCTGAELQLVTLGFGLGIAQRSLEWLQPPALLTEESCLTPEDFTLKKLCFAQIKCFSWPETKINSNFKLAFFYFNGCC